MTNNEIKSLKIGLELGMNLIDTAEMYGDGLSVEDLKKLEKVFKKTNRKMPLDIV